jgi:hypothetical protein
MVIQNKPNIVEVNPGIYEREDTPKSVVITRAVSELYVRNLSNAKKHKKGFLRRSPRDNIKRFLRSIQSGKK